MSGQVWKLQWPIAPSTGPVLAYPRDEQPMMMLRQSAALRRRFGTRLKIFVEAEVVDGELKLGHEVENPGW